MVLVRFLQWPQLMLCSKKRYFLDIEYKYLRLNVIAIAKQKIFVWVTYCKLIFTTSWIKMTTQLPLIITINKKLHDWSSCPWPFDLLCTHTLKKWNIPYMLLSSAFIMFCCGEGLTTRKGYLHRYIKHTCENTAYHRALKVPRLGPWPLGFLWPSSLVSLACILPSGMKPQFPLFMGSSWQCHGPFSKPSNPENFWRSLNPPKENPTPYLVPGKSISQATWF